MNHRAANLWEVSGEAGEPTAHVRGGGMPGLALSGLIELAPRAFLMDIPTWIMTAL